MKKEILISSDSNYDNLVAEIYIDGKYIALVSYDEEHNFFVETPTTKIYQPWFAILGFNSRREYWFDESGR